MRQVSSLSCLPSMDAQSHSLFLLVILQSSPVSSSVLAKKLLCLCAAGHEVDTSVAQHSVASPLSLLHSVFFTCAVLGWVSPVKLQHCYFYHCLRLSLLGKLGNDSYILLVFLDRETYHFTLFVFLKKIVTLGIKNPSILH